MCRKLGDAIADNLALLAAWQHVRVQGAKDILTWQRSVLPIAATGFESRTAELDLQDSVANIIAVE
jgi:hypothetical protein